ncbi:uncharacterized protein LOC133191389 isoform X1 [Saccostrea echinata]|uniref:uncharacterized protein LOC133191389 isoform X1 n=2 Tax=Saccostrea echinata TaxID=191078 RepID=UPI002A7FF3D8|nr:uncharacterized protein LOC133191389 isoform X1 [Saccostrea echinata]
MDNRNPGQEETDQLCYKGDFQNEAVKGLSEIVEYRETMATPSNGRLPPSAASSDQLSMEFEITSVDDDILNTVEKLFNFGKSGTIPYETIQDILGKAIQAERNHWKDRLNSAMQEIERQHKILLTEQSSLQDLCGMFDDNNKPANNEKPSEDILEENLTTEQLIQNLKFKIEHLKQISSYMEQSKEVGSISDKFPSKKKYSEMDIKFMKNAIAKIHFEKESLQSKLTEKETEIKWLQKELNGVKNQLYKLQDIVKEYNEDHQGAQFHLNQVEASPRQSLKTSDRFKKERTYIEGDQLQSYPIPSEESALWKLRLRSQVYSTRKGNVRTGVTQCLRCQKLFKPSDNGPKACRFHNKGREIKEQYDENGKLSNVIYKWACCKKGLDTVGCSTGYHI